MFAFENAEIGKQIQPFSIRIDWSMYKQYNRLVHEINPLHFNEKYAQTLGYRTIVVAGVFTASFFLRPVLSLVRNPSYIINYEIRFHNPVYLGDTITNQAVINKKYEKEGKNYVEFDVWVENQDKKKVTSGTVTVALNA